MTGNGNTVKIFLKDGCGRCARAKDLAKQLEGENFAVEYHNTSEVKGLTEAVVFEVMTLPSVIIANSENKELKGWRGKPPTLEEIKTHL